jgi:P-type Ca2+ transporter type 2C
MTTHGLNDVQVESLLSQYGENSIDIHDENRFWKKILDVIREPMFILLSAACTLYFILGRADEGLMMIIAIIMITAISIFQEVKSSNALRSLKDLTMPMAKVIRNGIETAIKSNYLVPGDIMIIEEGDKLPADGLILEGNDLTVNESILTGESLPVGKGYVAGEDLIFQGTVVNSGRCTVRVTATGNRTQLGKIGKAISGYAQTKTLLQQQINRFVQRFAFFGLFAFFLIFLLNYLENNNLVSSLLFALTLAMSAIPEEITVAFSSFMALGAYHMSRLGIITRQPLTIENLGSVNVICLDKTGTITENKMQVEAIYDHQSGRVLKIERPGEISSEVIDYGLLASERKPFDAMEKAIVEASAGNEVYMNWDMIKEYPLEGQPPMMTHVYEKNGERIVAAKGGVERILRVSELTESERNKVLIIAREFASKGCRVLGVAGTTDSKGNLPDNQDGYNWQFKGLISLYDPPKPFVKETLQEFTDAGIIVKLVTGDFPETAMTIAGKTGIVSEGYVTGSTVMEESDQNLAAISSQSNVFARMYPEAKLKLIRNLMNQGYIVAMTGDGVNDAPALKSASIGIAVGTTGNEVARESADLIITDDDLSKITEAIRQGRKILTNFKKAIRYIISIHIPIILIASLPLLLGWKYPNVFTPIHVIFLELIMGPTCSIFFEREPVESFVMQSPPRRRNEPLFTKPELYLSILQGLVITLGILVLYYFFMAEGEALITVRTIVFTTLILSNIFLTFTNRSFSFTILTTARYKNTLAVPVLIVSLLFLLIILFIPFAHRLFGTTTLTFQQFAACLLTALTAVGWFEIYKWLKIKHAAYSLPAIAGQ